MKLSEMKSSQQMLTEQLEDPAFREEWDRTALARKLGVSQPLVARLEAGEHEPTLTSLSRLSRRLGLEFHIDITPSSLRLSA